MKIKSVKNKIRRLCGVTLTAVVTALTVGCVGSTGLEEGNYGELILPKGEAWVHTFDSPNNLPSPNSSSTARSVSPDFALIFKADGKVDRLSISSGEWYVEYQLSWSTLGNEMTFRDKDDAMTFTFSLTGKGSEQILTLGSSGRPQGFERRAIEISDGKN